MLEHIPDNDLLASYLAVYARWIVGGMLLVAGVAKARALGEFILTIELFRLLPRQLSKAVAWLVIGLELVIAIALLVGIGTPFAAAAAALLFSVFTAAIVVNLARHNLVACNCFGPSFKEQISFKTVIRNLLFITFCLFIVKFYDRYFALEAWWSGSSTAQDHFSGLFFLLTGIIIVTGISALSVRAIIKSLKLVKSESAR